MIGDDYSGLPVKRASISLELVPGGDGPGDGGVGAAAAGDACC